MGLILKYEELLHQFLDEAHAFPILWEFDHLV